MIRSEVEELLRLRRELTHESLSDGTVTAWLDALRTTGYTAAREAMYLAAHRTERVTLKAFADALRPDPVETAPRRTNTFGDCLHEGADEGMRCPDCGQRLVSYEEGMAFAIVARDTERQRIIAAALAGDHAAQRRAAYRLTGSTAGWTSALEAELRGEDEPA